MGSGARAEPLEKARVQQALSRRRLFSARMPPNIRRKILTKGQWSYFLACIKTGTLREPASISHLGRRKERKQKPCRKPKMAGQPIRP